MNVENDQLSSAPLLGVDAERSTRSDDALELQDQRSNRRLQRTLSLMISPLIDDTGSGWGVVLGLFTLIIVGSTVGLCLPKNESLPTHWYRYISSAIGYTYFLCWSVSFYPQVISNVKRGSTHGLSVDFCGFNVLGFGCYAIYNISFFWSKTVQDEYRQRHGEDAKITVQSNDVAFAVHALLLSLLTLVQIAYYGGLHALRPSRIVRYTICVIVCVCLVYGGLVLCVANLKWLDFLYMLSFIKILISLIKYIPQVILNIRRKSTIGWSIWNVLLDLTGGILSDLQLVLDCADLGDWTGITGNLAKFGLGFVSVTFDLIFMLQHYVLYRHERSSALIIEDLKSDEDVA